MNGRRVGIAGVGLIGGSIALRARAFGARVIGYDCDVNALERGRSRGAIDDVEFDLRVLAARCQTLVIALPLDATVAALSELINLAGPELVIDVASVKAPLAPYAGLVPQYVGTHPMAGRERGGIDAADGRLFENATWAYVPPREPGLRACARAFIAAMGARALEIDAFEHDLLVALTSHLPQVLSVALGATLARAIQTDADVTELCGPGILSMLRLARSPVAMWSPIVTANAGPLAHQLRSFAEALLVAADGLDRGDSASLMAYFDLARSASSALDERFPPIPRP